MRLSRLFISFMFVHVRKERKRRKTNVLFLFVGLAGPFYYYIFHYDNVIILDFLARRSRIGHATYIHIQSANGSLSDTIAYALRIRNDKLLQFS